MKLSYTILIVILLSTLMFGCVKENYSEKICTIMKESRPDYTTRMDNDVCILEHVNYTNVYYMSCNTITFKASIIIKTNKTMTDDDLPNGCFLSKTS
jgi:hypothetical protein